MYPIRKKHTHKKIIPNRRLKFNLVSINAPTWEANLGTEVRGLEIRFNSHPHTESDKRSASAYRKRSVVSTHALTRRATHNRVKLSHVTVVSIHPPHKRGGVVRYRHTSSDIFISFNPRPHKEGDAIHAEINRGFEAQFQLTPLHTQGGRNSAELINILAEKFQSTPSQRGRLSIID